MKKLLSTVTLLLQKKKHNFCQGQTRKSIIRAFYLCSGTDRGHAAAQVVVVSKHPGSVCRAMVYRVVWGTQTLTHMCGMELAG